MTIQTTAMKDIVANAYHTAAAFGAAYTTVPGASAGTEPSGGSPAYARKPLSWPAGNGSSVTATFDIPSGATIAGAGLHSALTAGTYYDGGSVSSQPFASQGTYAVTFTFTTT